MIIGTMNSIYAYKPSLTNLNLKPENNKQAYVIIRLLGIFKLIIACCVCIIQYGILDHQLKQNLSRRPTM